VRFLFWACAAGFAGLAALGLTSKRSGLAGQFLVLAAAVTAAWSMAVALFWPDMRGLPPELADVLRSLAWYGFVLYLYRRTVSDTRLVTYTMGTTGLIGLVTASLAAGRIWLSGPSTGYASEAGIAAQLCIAVCAILLIENIWRNTDQPGRWHVNLACIGVLGLFTYDVILAGDTVLLGRTSPTLFAGRALGTLFVAPFLALHIMRNRDRPVEIRMSRAAAFHSATLVVSGLFFLSLAVVGEMLRRFGSAWGGVAEVGLLFAGLLSIAILITSGTARSRLRTTIVDNFFTHRYDYRTEWNRCTEILTTRESYVPMHARVIRALAEIVDSPAGVLFLRDRDGLAFAWAGSWNLPTVAHPIMAEHPIVQRLETHGEAIELSGLPADATLPDVTGDCWLAVPLGTDDHMLGFVVLDHPRADFRLDAEVFALLRTVGRMSATFIAEQRVAQELAQANDLQIYAKQFAFVAHDIKNIASQLSMLLANAEVHLQNPEFQRDMLGTVRSSTRKIQGLLRRLQDPGEATGRAVTVPTSRLADLVACTPRPNGIDVRLDDDSKPGAVAISQTAFDSVITHLLGNAIEASLPDQPVTVRVRHDASRLVIDIVDQGTGMSPEFIRDTLFRPFGTAKHGGTGIGAYQARELVRSAGGDLIAISETGAGTTMRLFLPLIGMSAGSAPQRTP
jgi:putative PEP-CTERM system histidine kinase